VIRHARALGAGPGRVCAQGASSANERCTGCGLFGEVTGAPPATGQPHWPATSCRLRRRPARQACTRCPERATLPTSGGGATDMPASEQTSARGGHRRSAGITLTLCCVNRARLTSAIAHDGATCAAPRCTCCAQHSSSTIGRSDSSGVCNRTAAGGSAAPAARSASAAAKREWPSTRSSRASAVAARSGCSLGPAADAAFGASLWV